MPDRRTRVRLVIAAVALVATAKLGHAAATPAQTCRAVKNTIAGKYAACRQNAESAFAKSNDATKRSAALLKCKATFTTAWKKADDKAAAKQVTCLDKPLTDANFSDAIDLHTTSISDGLAGSGLSDATQDLAQCNTDKTQCQSSLATCTTGQTQCQSNLTTCTTSSAQCQADLAESDEALGNALACGNGSIDGTEDCDNDDLGSATCASRLFVGGGTLRCSSGCKFDTSDCFLFRFTDTGAGTVIDNQTGLEWEKKVGTFGVLDPTNPHNVNNFYTWSAGGTAPSGTVFSDFLARLNGANDTFCFNDRCDWRLPEIDELGSIRQCPVGGGTCIDAAFGISSDIYVTNNSAGVTALSVQALNFAPGPAGIIALKSQTFGARAVRTRRPNFSQP